jgi:putative phage-type endonuclease
MNITQKIERYNSARLFGKAEAGSATWLKWRRESITGSDISSIVGLNPWKSALTLYYQKTGELQEQEATTRMMLGNYLEEGIANLFQDLNPNLKVYRDLGTFAKVDAPVYKANPDGVIEDQLGNLSVVEIKHTSQWWNEVPMHYQLQVMWYQYVLGLKNPATLVAVTGGDLREFVVEYDETLIEKSLEAVNLFLGLLNLGVAPDYDGSNSTYETVRELTGDIMEGDKELSCGADLFAAKSIFDAAESNLNRYKSQALDELAGTKVGTYQGVEIVRLAQRGTGKPYLTFTKGN